MSKTDLVLEAGAALAGINHPVLAAVMSGIKLTKGAVRQVWPNADDRLADALVEEIHEAVLTVVPQINKRVKQIEEKLGDTPSPTQAAIIWTSFVRGFSEAEGRKRKLLLNALVNAFDPVLYEQSMTIRLLATMDALGYADLSYLVGMGKAAQPWQAPDELAAYHATQLLEHGLLYRNRALQDKSQEMRQDIAIVSGLGKWMIKLIQDPETADL